MFDTITDSFDTESLTLGRAIAAVVALIAAYLISRLVRRRLTSSLEDNEDVSEGTPEPVGRIAGWCVVLVGVVVALMLLGFEMGPLVLLLAMFAGLAAIAGKGVLENFSAGLSLQLSRAFTVGDRIEVEDATGWVEAIDSHAVVLKTPDGRRVRVPNRDVLDSIFVNYTDTDFRRSEVTFSVAYGQDLRDVRKIALGVAVDAETTVGEPEPTAFIQQLGNGVEFMLRFFHTDDDRFEARHEVQQGLVDAFDEAGIEFTTAELIVHQAADNGEKSDHQSDAAD